MGFDLHLILLKNGRSAPSCRKIVENIFNRDALYPCELQEVTYADGRGEIYCGSEDEEFDGFMLSHFGGRTICERFLDVAHVTQSLMFWPSYSISFGVTDRAVLAYLPAELSVDKEKIALVGTVDELWMAINAEEGASDGVVIVSPAVR